MRKAKEKAASKANLAGPEEELAKTPDLSVPHVCSGQFQVDFTELCRRLQPPPFYIPQVLPRPHRPTSPSLLPVIDEKPGKVTKASTKNQPIPEVVEVESPVVAENGEIQEPPPKTYLVKDRFDYFRPCIHVEMDTTDKQDAVAEIYIKGWRIDEPMMDVLRQCWTAQSKLNTISLWSVGLTTESVEALSSCLQLLPTLRSLILDNNPVKSEPWYLLLKDDSPLQHLSLRYNGITDVGAETIGKELGSTARQNQKLLSLNLAGNKITDRGVCHIAAGLRLNRSLLCLGLNGNQISDDGAKKLAELISRFALTHEEVIARRKLLSVNTDRKNLRSASPPGKKDKQDRPGSVRSTTSALNSSSTNVKGTGSTKQSSKVKKGDQKQPKEDDAKHDKSKSKTKEPEKPPKKDLATRRTSTVTAPSEAGKSQSKKGSDKSKGKGKQAQQAESEVADVSEFINPLLESIEQLSDGTLLMKGNMMLINLNLADNKIGEAGAEALLMAVKYQTTIAMVATQKAAGSGLMRLSMQRNQLPRDSATLKSLSAFLATRDPLVSRELEANA